MIKILKITLTAVLASLTLCVSGCEDFSFMSFETSGINSIKKTHLISSEDETRSFTLSEKETCVVSFDIETNDGEVDITLVNANGDVFYSGNDVPTSAFTVNLSETGKYTLTVQPNSHSGSLDILWEITEL
jgi:hypothetical protein